MNKYEEKDWVRSHDMPHEHIMDEHSIEYSELSASIQADIRRFDKVYDEALADGFIDDDEENELIAESYKIKTRIEKEHLKQEEGSKGSGGVIGGVIAGVGIALLTLFGINQIREK